MSDADENKGRERLWELIKDMRFGMFITRAEDGSLHSHPMTMQNKSLDAAVLQFFMSRSGEPCTEARRDPTVAVAFADPKRDAWVSVSGIASERDDVEVKRKLWSTMTQAWFPDGPEDPDVALVEVRIDRAHYWDVKQNQAVQLFKMLKAAATGTTPKNMGESAEVKMR